jgi:hypothetical protein
VWRTNESTATQARAGVQHDAASTAAATS